MAFADTLAWAQAQPAGSTARILAGAYASGTTRVTVDGRTVQYRSLNEMERALSALHASQVPATMRRPRVTVARIGDGR